MILNSNRKPALITHKQELWKRWSFLIIIFTKELFTLWYAEQQTELQSELFVTDVRALSFRNPRIGETSDFLLCHVLQVGPCLDLKGYAFSSSSNFPFFKDKSSVKSLQNFIKSLFVLLLDYLKIFFTKILFEE